MKSKKTIIIIVQFILILIISGVYVFIQQAAVKPTKCYTYKENYKEGTILTADNFEECLVPKDGVSETMMTDISQIDGMILDNNVLAGHYVYVNEFIAEENADTFKQVDTSELRRYTIAVSRETALGGDIKSGDFVDLMFSGEAKVQEVPTADGLGGSNSEKSLYYTKIFMSKVRVYKVTTNTGADYVNSTGAMQNGEDGQAVEGMDPAFVTLAVTAEQLQEIKTRQNLGEVTIVGLFKDTVESTASGFTMTDTDVYTEYMDPETNLEIKQSVPETQETPQTETPTDNTAKTEAEAIEMFE